jgi:hypothetical protein
VSQRIVPGHRHLRVANRRDWIDLHSATTAVDQAPCELALRLDVPGIRSFLEQPCGLRRARWCPTAKLNRTPEILLPRPAIHLRFRPQCRDLPVSFSELAGELGVPAISFSELAGELVVSAISFSELAIPLCQCHKQLILRRRVVQRELRQYAFTAFGSAPFTMRHPPSAKASTISPIFIRFTGSASQHDSITRINAGDAVGGIEGRSFEVTIRIIPAIPRLGSNAGCCAMISNNITPRVQISDSLLGASFFRSSGAEYANVFGPRV